MRALLARCRSLGLTEIRLSISSADIAALRTAVSLGFRPVQLQDVKGLLHQTLIANPQLPEPPAAELKLKAAALGTHRP